MLQVRDGDAQAFEELMLRYQNRLMSLLAHLIGQRDLAEDLTQEVFLRVIKARAEWKGESKFTTWVYAIARNICIDHARRAVHRDARSLDAPTRPDDEAGRVVGQASACLRDQEAGRGLPYKNPTPHRARA